MIQRLREPFGAAAVALIQPNDIEARDPGFLRDSQHITRFRRTLETVQKNDRRMAAWILLHVTLRADLRSRLDFKKPGTARRKSGVFTPPKRGGNRHRMRIAKPSRRNEFFHRIHGRQSGRIAQLDWLSELLDFVSRSA